MSIKNIIVSIIAVATLSTFSMAQGGRPNQPPRGGGGENREGMRPPGGGGMQRGGGQERREMDGMQQRGRGMGMAFGALNLTDDQKQKIQALHESHKTMMEANKAQMEEMGKLMGYKRSGLLTSAQGTRLTALEAQMETRMKTNSEKMQADLMTVLTADQKVLFEKMKQRRPEGMKRPGGGQEKRGGPGGQKTPPPTDN